LETFFLRNRAMRNEKVLRHAFSLKCYKVTWTNSPLVGHMVMLSCW
jgi:hypothetical protein